MIFLYLILGHLLADFIFQPDSLILWKNKSWVGVLIHALIHFVVEFILFLIFIPPIEVIAALLGIVSLHFFIDIAKVYLEKKKGNYVALFFCDQFAHIVILLLAGFFIMQIPLHNFQNHILVSLYENPYVLIYIILSIGVSYVFDITRLQFMLEKNSAIKFRPHFKKMFFRWIVFSLFYVGVIFLQFLLVHD